VQGDFGDPREVSNLIDLLCRMYHHPVSVFRIVVVLMFHLSFAKAN